MPVSRRTYRDRKTGKTRRAATYTVRFEFRLRTVTKGGFHDRKAAEHWESQEKARLSRGEVGYVQTDVSADVLPLIEGYAANLRTLRRDAMYVYNTEKRLRRLREECGWLTLGNVTGQSLERWRARGPKWRGRPVGAKTLNQFLETAIGWCAWLVEQQVIATNPFERVSRVRAVQNVEARRPATVDELARLLAKAPEDRRRLYRFLIYCPLRRAAFEGLRWKHLDLDATPALVNLPPELNKTRTPLILPLRADVAAELRKVRGQAGERVFPAVTMDEWRADLVAAEVEYDRGGKLDMHALRMTAVGLMADAGVGFEEAHRILGHLNRGTTEKWYYRGKPRASLVAATEAMPKIGEGL